MMKNDYIFKYILVGDQSVGKSCIMNQFIQQKFNPRYQMTVGVEFGSKIIEVANKQIKLQIWDTSGQESFRSITRSYYSSAAGAILVYDITNRKSFEHISYWMDQILQNGSQSVSMILVGNKQDLETQRKVSTEEAQSLANQWNLLFFETSAKTSMNVATVFEESAKQIHQKILDQTIDIESEFSGIRKGNNQQLSPQQPQQNSKGYCCYYL